MSIQESSRVAIEGVDGPLDEVRARLSHGCGPVVNLLEHLSDVSLDELSSDLDKLEKGELSSLVKAVDTLNRLSSRLDIPQVSSRYIGTAPVHGSTSGSQQGSTGDPDRDPLRETDELFRASAGTSNEVMMSVEELSSMLVELMSSFESSADYDAVNNASWRSPCTRCQVCKSGQSAALLCSLQQDPEAVFADYRICLDGEEVWLWSDKVWPDLSVEASVTPTVRIPKVCLDLLTRYLEQHSAEWVERWRSAEQCNF